MAYRSWSPTMRVSLDTDEVRLLTDLIQAAERERASLIGRASSPAERDRLEKETQQLAALRQRLAELHREEVLDESSEESFPASDSPARSVVKDRRDAL
jgi:hypothetical protein